jgi:hypothetical protein
VNFQLETPRKLPQPLRSRILRPRFAMSFDQGQFNFDAAGSESGYHRWREELDAARKAFELRWGVILSRRVVVMLQDHDKPLEGLLRQVPQKGKKRNAPPEFELCGLRFTAGMIRSIVQVD